MIKVSTLKRLEHLEYSIQAKNKTAPQMMTPEERNSKINQYLRNFFHRLPEEKRRFVLSEAQRYKALTPCEQIRGRTPLYDLRNRSIEDRFNYFCDELAYRLGAGYIENIQSKEIVEV